MSALAYATSIASPPQTIRSWSGIHTQFVGEIVDVKADQEVLDPHGLPDAEKVRPIIYDTGTRNYFGIGQLLGKGFSIGKDLHQK